MTHFRACFHIHMHGPEHKKKFQCWAAIRHPLIGDPGFEMQTRRTEQNPEVVRKAVEVASSEVLGVSSEFRLWIPSIAMQLNAI